MRLRRRDRDHIPTNSYVMDNGAYGRNCTVGDGASGGEAQFSRRRRGRGAADAASRTVTPLSRTWPSGCALNWEERERVSRAALKRCSQAPVSTGRGIDSRSSALRQDFG